MCSDQIFNICYLIIIIIIVYVLNTENKMHIEYFYYTEEWLQIGNTRVLNAFSGYTSFCTQISY